jgi:hypothetical protein
MENNAHSIFPLRYDRREVCFPETSKDSKRLETTLQRLCSPAY